jgi:hypothetical protein
MPLERGFQASSSLSLDTYTVLLWDRFMCFFVTLLTCMLIVDRPRMDVKEWHSVFQALTHGLIGKVDVDGFAFLPAMTTRSATAFSPFHLSPSKGH